MSEDQRKQLQTQLWNIANELRGKMNPDEFRDYILGFIFYKYLSEKITIFADDLLKADGVRYDWDIDESAPIHDKYIEAVKVEAIDALGYFLNPKELFHYVATHGTTSGDLIENLERILNNIQNSTMGHDSEDDFESLFSELDLNSQRLGKTVAARGELIAKVLVHLDKIDFQLQNSQIDVLGDAYEYMIGQFASGAGKKAGEFYTPQEVSQVLARIVTDGKKRLKSVYDPTCGSGSLLLRVAKYVDEVGHFYGQELNNTTYNLARMNMILHDVSYDRFDIKQEDTLEHPQHKDMKFEAIVANPPFSAAWSADPLFLEDERFRKYGVLAPKKPADYAFLLHMIHQLDDNGILAVVMPHGALNRGRVEQKIRKTLISDQNYLDAVIGLPANIFFGTESPACIMVFKKCRKDSDSVIFIDASQNFDNNGTKNKLRASDIEDIILAYTERKSIDKFSRAVQIDEIAVNSYNLNIPKYINRLEDKRVFDLVNITKNIRNINHQLNSLHNKMELFYDELGVNDIDDVDGHKIFSGELRFKDSDGRAFPAWDYKKLHQLTTKVKEKNVAVRYRNVLTNSAKRGIISQRDYFDKDIANQNNLSGYYIVMTDDFVYNPRISSSAPVGPIKRNHQGIGVMSPLYSVFRFNEECDLSFYEKYFSTNLWYQYLRGVANYGARHDRMSISQEDFQNMVLPFPSIQEQRKIAEFLDLFDHEVLLEEARVSELKNYSNGILYSMLGKE